MRLPLAATLSLLSVSALFLILLPPRGRVESELQRAVPAGALGVIVLNNPSKDLELPSQIDLGAWISGDPGKVLEKIPPAIRDQIGSLMKEDLDEAWGILHRLEPRESGAWRIHFSALLKPKPGHLESVREHIRRAMESAFGEGMESAEEGPIRVFKGSQPGQFLFQVRLAGFLVVSNSAEGRDDSLRSWFGKGPRISGSPGFQRVKAHLPSDQGVFLYCDCKRILPVLPEFGYQIERRAGAVRSRSFVVEGR